MSHSQPGVHEREELLLWLDVNGEHGGVGHVGQRHLVTAVLGLHRLVAQNAHEQL